MLILPGWLLSDRGGSVAIELIGAIGSGRFGL